ncbi:hypothetical protein [Lacinutrix sp. MEBiC02595]
MKTMFITFLFLGFAQVTYSQSDIAYTETTDHTLESTHVKKDFNSVSEKIIGTSYLSAKTKKLQLQVFNYNIKNAAVYAANVNTTYSVHFTEGNNHVDAIYAKDGTLLQSEGIFKNVRIPYNISVKVAKKYAGWMVAKTYCYNNYRHNKDTEVLYKMQLRKGNKTKAIEINPMDDIL